MRTFRAAITALALAGVLILLPRDLRAAASCTWDGSSNDWDTLPTHWTGCGIAVPGASDTAIISSGTVTLFSTNHPVTGVTLSGGVINGAGDLTVSGAFSWTGGTMSGSGTTTIAATSTLTINAGAVGVQRTLTNNGTITWVAGQIQMVNGTIDNNATFTAQPDNSLGNFGGTNAFHNNASGTFTRNTGTGNLDIGIPFTNAGTTTVSTGTLRIQGGGTSTGTIDASSTALTFNNSYSVTAGTFNVGTLNLPSGTIDMTPGTYTVTTVNLSGSTYNLNKASSASNWTHSSGVLSGSGAVTVSSGKTYSWTGGTMAGSATTTVAAGGTLTINAGAVGVQRTLTNNGTITWVAGQIQMVNGTIDNNATFTAQPDNSLGNFGGTNAFHNNASGTFTRNTGTGNLDIGIPFTNAGTTTVSTGTLRIQGGGTSTGTIDASSTALTFNNSYSVTAGTFNVGTLNLPSGTIDMTPGTYTVTTVNLSGSTYNLNKASSASNWTHSSGVLSGSGAVTVSSGKTYSWTGGTMAGSATTTVAAGGTLTINAGAVGVQRTLTNNGTITWVAGQIQMVNGTIDNNATFTAQPDNSLGNFGGTNAFHNNASGTFTRNTGTGNLDIGIPFTNAGTTTVSTGTLRIQGGGTSTGTIDASSTALTFNNSYSVTAGTFNVGTLNLPSGTIDMTPGTYTVTTVNLSGSTYNLNKASSASNWTHSSGVLSGSGAVTVSSGKTYSWTGGTMAGSATTTVAAGGTLTINAGAVGVQRTLTNNGTITWVAGQIQMVNGTIDNNATFTAQPDNSLGNFGGTNAFHNNASGTFTRNTGTGNLDIGIPFTNAGTTTVSTGTLRIQGGGTSTGTIDASSTALTFNNSYSVTAGTFNVGTLNLPSGTIDMTPGTYTVTTVNLSGSTYNLNKASSASNWTHSSGVLSGSGAVTVSSGKTYSWTGGTMAGSATTTVAAGGTLTINAGAVGVQRTLTNNGTITWVAGQIQMVNGTIDNNATFTAQPDNSLGNFGGTNAFHNNASGTFTRNTGTGNLDIGIPFTNAGTTTVSTGTLRIQGGGTSTGTIDASSTALTFNNSYSVTAGTFNVGTLNLPSGTIDMTPGTYTVTTVNLSGSTYNLNKASSASNWTHSSGVLSGSGAVTVSSGKTYSWTGGTMAGSATTTVAAGGTLTINAGAVGVQRTLTNNGTITWVAGQIQMVNGTIDNNATFTAQPDNSLGNFGGTNAFHNNASGTFTRNTGAGNLDIGIPFTNAGTVNASSGTLRFQGVFTQTAGFTILNGGNVSSNSGLNIQGGTLKGSGTITGNVFNGGTVAPGLSPGTLTITGNFAQTAAGTLSIEINGLTPGTQHDQVIVNGTVALAGGLTVTSGFTPSQGDGFQVITNDAADAVSGTFTGLPESGVVAGGAENYRISYLAGTGNDVVLKAGPAANAQALTVDPVAGAGGDGNGVFEPSETVLVEPSWKNEASNSISLTGAASNFGGPGSSTYSIPDAAAAYGTISPGATVNCLSLSNCFSMHVTAPASRPSTHWDATFTETPSTLADPPKVWTLHLGDSFTDVPRSQLFYRRIETLVHTGVTAGCGVGTYCPNDPVNRAQMAIFIAKGIAGGGPNVPVSGSFNAQPYNCVNGGSSLFTDVTPTDIFCKHVHYMAVQNVTLGCGGGQYCPNGAISRSDMAIFVAKAIVAPQGGAGVPETYGPDPVTGFSYSCAPGSPNLHFTDISTSDSFCKHVHYLWARNIVSGCSATAYCPTLGVTRDQMARFLGNAFNLVLYAP